MPKSSGPHGPRDLALRLRQVRQGAASFAWPQPTVGLDGTPHTPAQLDQALGTLLAPFAKAHDAFVAYQEALRDRRVAERQAQALLTALRTGFSAMLGRRHEKLAKLGFRPDLGRRELTSGEKLVAQAKRKRTQGALGPSEKKAFKASPPPPFRVTPSGKIELLGKGGKKGG